MGKQSILKFDHSTATTTQPSFVAKQKKSKNKRNRDCQLDSTQTQTMNE